MTPSPYALDLWRDENPLPVVAYATCRRVSGEPGSLSITAGWDVDIARVLFGTNEIEITPSEREKLQRLVADKQG